MWSLLMLSLIATWCLWASHTCEYILQRHSHSFGLYAFLFLSLHHDVSGLACTSSICDVGSVTHAWNIYMTIMCLSCFCEYTSFLFWCQWPSPRIEHMCMELVVRGFACIRSTLCSRWPSHSCWKIYDGVSLTDLWNMLIEA